MIFVHFDQAVYFRWQPATSLQNFIHLRRHLEFNFSSIFWHTCM